MTSQGRLITFEGGEGTGKTTQIGRLADFIRMAGREVVLTREPGGSEGAETIRRLLVSGDTARWLPMTEALLHYAARCEHLDKVILPAMARGAWVLCDRFADSTMAYQGWGHGLEHSAIERLHDLVVGKFSPDLTFILDLPPDVGLERARVRAGAEDRYERMDPAFHVRLREGFLEIARREPGRCVVIDAREDIDAVFAAIRNVVSGRFGLTPE